jgi:putative oxidoreductase
MNLLAACVAIGCVGPGRWSLDNAIGFHPGGWWGLAIVLVVGVGGTVALLAVFWRPPAPAPAT